MKPYLTQMKEQLEGMAVMDFTKTPNMLCIQALIDALVNEQGFSYKFAKKIVFRMQVKVSQFDAKNEDWQSIISNMAIMIQKLYDIIEDSDTMLEVAKSLELKYSF